MIKIIHLTSVHPRYDTRIFVKMCSSLAKEKDFDVSLVVADGKGSEVKSDVKFFDVGMAKGRVDRIFNITQKVFKKAIELDGDIYHLHDPELIPIGIKLKKLGKKVIFDSHEDVPKQIIDREYLPKWILKIISFVLLNYERYACSKFDAIVTATPTIRDKFLQINKNSLDINNYPIIDELLLKTDWNNRKNNICYIGTIDIARGIKEIVLASKDFKNSKLVIGGRFSFENTKIKIESLQEWQNINFLGFLDRNQVKEVLESSKVGLVTLHPIPNYLESLPVKMFEYMSAGIAVVASNFPLWREIIEKNNCGICVNPLNPKEIADAVNYLIENPEIAEKMGKNGQKAVIEKYNWNNEYKKLLNLYKGLL